MSESDRSGRQQVSKNVVTSWASYVVFVIFGFVMPRMIDDSLGQTLLGIWDFGWTIVHYLAMAMVSIGSSVNRYVARYLASGEYDKLSGTVCSVVAIQLAIAAGVAVATIVLAQVIPAKMAANLGEHSEVAGQVVLFLGMALVVQMAFDSFRGILTGCHRWTAYNVINAGSYAISAIGMIIVLLRGGGLVAMAIVFLAITVISEIIRAILAIRACPEVEYRASHVNRADIGKVFRFGFKNVVIYLPRLIIQQTVSIFVVSSLGPAMFAVLARPLALVTHVSTLVNKFAHVLTPTAGSLQGGGRTEDLKIFAIQTMRAGWMFAALPCIYLFVLGDRLVDLWMGGGYANWSVVAILSAGFLMPIAASAILHVVIGMNEHGRIAKLSIYMSILSVLVSIPLVMRYGWSLELASFIIALPANIGIGGLAIVIGCRVLKISAWEFVRDVIRDPLLVTAICAATLYGVRLLDLPGNAATLALGAVAQSIVILVVLRKDVREVVMSLRGRSHQSVG